MFHDFGNAEVSTLVWWCGCCCTNLCKRMQMWRTAFAKLMPKVTASAHAHSIPHHSYIEQLQAYPITLHQFITHSFSNNSNTQMLERACVLHVRLCPTRRWSGAGFNLFVYVLFFANYLFRLIYDLNWLINTLELL